MRNVICALHILSETVMTTSCFGSTCLVKTFFLDRPHAPSRPSCDPRGVSQFKWFGRPYCHNEQTYTTAPYSGKVAFVVALSIKMSCFLGSPSDLKNLFPTKTRLFIFLGYMALFVNQGTCVVDFLLLLLHILTRCILGSTQLNISIFYLQEYSSLLQRIKETNILTILPPLSC